MAKTNYTKVEEALAEGMHKMEVNRLLDIADQKGDTTKDQPKKLALKLDALHLQRLNTLNNELKDLQKKGKDPYAKLKIDPAEIKRLLKDPSALTPEEWAKVKTMNEQVAVFKAEIERKPLQNSDDDIVKQQRKKQITKRFNVNDKWIPLR